MKAPPDQAAPVAPSVASTAPASTTAATAPVTEELAFTACGLLNDNPLLGPEAVMRITNRTAKPMSVYVLVGFFSKDGRTQYDTGHSTAEGLGAGQSREDEASSLKPELRKHGRNGFTCKVLDVTRTDA